MKGNSLCSIVKLFNEENILDREWKTRTIDDTLSNYKNIGFYQHRKRVKNEKTILYEDVCPAIVDKHTFEIVQHQKEKNQKNHKRKHTYVYMQTVVCSKCSKMMGGGSCASKSNEKHIYYTCHTCKTVIAEKKLEKPLMNFLNDMFDYFLLIDNTFKPYLNKDTEAEVKLLLK